MIKSLAHICIHTEDLQKTSHFYTEILGLKKQFEFERDGEIFGFYLKLSDSTFIEVFKGTPGETGNIKHVAIEVEDMDGFMERLKEHGVAVGEKKRGADKSWQFWVTDPNGVRIEFQQYTPESLQRVGGKCVVGW